MKRCLLTAAVVLLTAGTLLAQRASVFTYGYARVQQNDKTWYINRAGEKAFDTIIGSYHPIDSVSNQGDGYQTVHTNEKRLLLVVRSNGKTGVADDQGNWVLKPEYDDIQLKWKTYLELSQKGKMTYADTWGKQLLPLEFEDAGVLTDTWFDVKQKGKWGVYSSADRKLLIPAIYDAIDYCGGCGMKSEYVYAQKNGKWGIVSFKNEVLVPFEYEHSHSMMRSDDWVQSFKKNGRDVLVNIPQKKTYGAPEYTSVGLIGDGLLKLEKNGRFGLLNADGKQLLDFQYDDITDPYGVYATGPYLVIVKNGKSGIINESGRIIAPPSYEDDITCAGDYYIASQQGKYNLFDSTGKPLLPQGYSEIGSLVLDGPDGAVQLFTLKQKALYGFYNPATRKTVAPAFHDIDKSSEELPIANVLEVNYQEKKGLYTADGQQLLPVQYKRYGFFTPNLALVKTDNGTGVYDVNKQKLVIPAQFYEVYPLGGENNLFQVTVDEEGKDHMYGLYDSSGAVLLPAAYSDIKAMNKGIFLLQSNTTDTTNQYDLYNIHTKKITLLSKSNVSLTDDPDVLIVSDGKNSYLWSVSNAKVLSDLYPMKQEPGYSRPMPAIPDFRSGLTAVEKDGKTGMINTAGKEVIPFRYEAARVLNNGMVMLLQQNKAENGAIQWKYGYADSTGKIVVPIVYDYDERGYLSDFDNSDWLLLYKYNDEDRYDRKQGLASKDGKIVVPASYDKILSGKNNNGFLVQDRQLFTVLDSAGKPVSHEKFDDVMLETQPVYGATAVSLSYPLLCRKDNKYLYLLADGKTLPLQPEDVISFVEESVFALPPLSLPSE